ncbi:hypothetical protein ACWZEH_12805 [Streptomyces sp. QTS137]
MSETPMTPEQRAVTGAAPQSRTMLDLARTALGARMAKDDLRLVLENVVTYADALRVRLDEVHRVPQDNVTPAEVRLEQYAQPPRTFASDTERALFQIACGLRDTLEETRDQRNSARLKVMGLEARVAELEAAPTTVYRAEHPDSGITLGHYGTEAAARAHCEATERRSWSTGTNLAFDWIEDDEDRVAELVVTAGQNEESVTGYIVTALELDSEYDQDGDE